MDTDCTHHCDSFAAVLVQHILNRVDKRGPCFSVAQPQVEGGFIEIDKWGARLNHLGQLHGEAFCSGGAPRQRLRIQVADYPILDLVANVKLLQAFLAE